MVDTSEVTVRMLAEVIAEQHATIELLRNDNARKNASAKESEKRDALLREERDQFAAENKLLSNRVARIERDLKLANRMVGKRLTRKSGK